MRQELWYNNSVLSRHHHNKKLREKHHEKEDIKHKKKTFFVFSNTHKNHDGDTSESLDKMFDLNNYLLYFLDIFSGIYFK